MLCCHAFERWEWLMSATCVAQYVLQTQLCPNTETPSFRTFTEPREAWAPSASRAPCKAAPPAHIVSNPHFNNNDFSSSGEESVDHHAQHCPDPETQPQTDEPPSDVATPGQDATMQEMQHSTPHCSTGRSQPATTRHSSDSPRAPIATSAPGESLDACKQTLLVVPGPNPHLHADVLEAADCAAHSTTARSQHHHLWEHGP